MRFGMLTGEHHMNAAQKLYASIGGIAVKAELGSLRCWGIDLRNPHARKAGPGRRHQQGQTCCSSRTTAA